MNQSNNTSKIKNGFVACSGFLMATILVTACGEKQTVISDDKTQDKIEIVKSSEVDFGFIAFGDSGYHLDYLKEKQFNPIRKNLEVFNELELKDWIDDYRTPSEFKATPSEFVPAVGSMVESSGLYPVANAMIKYCETASCEFSVMLGDNIYPDGATVGLDGKDDSTRFDDIFTKPLGGMGAGNSDYRIYTALGNHDWDTSREGAMAQVEFMETNLPFYMDGIAYSVKPPSGNGDIEIFVVDTEVILGGAVVFEAELNPDGSEKKLTEIDKPSSWTIPANDAEKNMLTWLDESLKNSTAKWKFVVAHHPIWSTGGTKFEQARTLRKLMLPSLCRYADIYFAGHEHSLELHEDTCASVFGENSNHPPLLEVISGAAAKQRGVHSSFKAYQTKTYPENNTIWAKGMIWGFSHIQLRGDNATITMHTTPNSGNGKSEHAYTYEYNRRSSVVSKLLATENK